MNTSTLRLSALRLGLGGLLLTSLAACGGGSSGSGAVSSASTASMPLVVSDASSDDWATIGVRVLSIALIPQGGSSNVTIYTAPSPAPYVNLEQLDELGEILGNVSVPIGTYTGAVVTISGNAGDVLLVTSSNPESGFIGAASTQISSSDIQIQHTQGSSGSLTVPVTVDFKSPLTVSSTSSNALDLEFDLAHPAFIVGHQPPGAGTTLWAVNFTGPVRHHPIADIRDLVLRHMYGSVTAVATDGSSITITKDYPTLPVQSPETAVTGSQSLNILADSSNGTIYYDVDAKTSTTVTSFASLSSLSGKYVRIAARYQENGTLVATRIWASSSFNSVYLSPEGHVLHVDSTNDTVSVLNEAGQPVQLTVNANTEFFFHGGSTAIGTGTSFLTSQNLVRGFKIHASVVDPLATPLVAQTIDIETAAYSGVISNPTGSSFNYTHDYLRTTDDYAVTLDYISSSTANGKDASGNAITGFDFWDFAYPTMITDGSSAISDFQAATSSSIAATGVSYATWGDPANSSGWSAPQSILLPVPLPLATVTTGLVTNGSSSTLTATPLAAASAITVDVSSTSGSATLVYQVDRSNGIVTVSAIDLTSTSGMTSFTDAMTAGTPLKIYGVPQSDGSLRAYVITYFTGTTMPAS